MIGLELEWLFAKALNLLMMILENLSYEQRTLHSKIL